MVQEPVVSQIFSTEIDQLLDRAEQEHWSELALFSSSMGPTLDFSSWPDFVKIPHNVYLLDKPRLRFSEIFRPLTDLNSLILIDEVVSDDDARAIAQLPNLTSLVLGGSHIGDGREFVEAITQLSALSSLVLEVGDLGDDGAKAIAKSFTRLAFLYLSHNSIGADGAKAIAALENLTSLELGNNRIGADGAKAIAALENLTSLDLGNNSIGDDGAKAIAALENLTSLDLRSNSIGDDGAKAIAALENLASLDLGNNSIGADGAKAIAALENLASLHLGHNSIGDDGAKAIAALENLTSLDLGNNSIGADGAKAILDAWTERSVTRHYLELDLRENKDVGKILPAELLENSFDPNAILAAYRRYQSAEEKQTLRPLNEAKLLVVGSEAVGKTSLIRYIIEGKPRDPSEQKTPGVDTKHDISMPKWSDADHGIRINIWDFGGQHMMQGTHRYFLTERSLYLLVLEDRRQDDNTIESRLRTIRNRGADSPVIVVINKSDRGKQDLRLPEAELKRAYPQIIGFYRTSCDPDEWAAESIKNIRRVIADTLASDPRLKHIRDPIPMSWLRVKEQISVISKKSSVLTMSDFERLCERPPADRDDGEDNITDPNEQIALLRLLRDLGTVVAHGLRRDAPAALREVTILDPNWLTGAIYRILTEPTVRDQNGEFSRGQLNSWLNRQTYPPERYEFILTMMQDPEIGLCFKLPSANGSRYLIPECLNPSPPHDKVWDRHNPLRFRYQYENVPEGLIPRFIVQSHRNSSNPPTRWRTGVVLEVEGCSVLVRGSIGAVPPKIDILVDGAHVRRRSALDIVRNDLDAIHTLYEEISCERRVPLPGDPARDVSYDHLLELEHRYGPGHEFLPEKAKRTYTVQELLHGIIAGQSVTASPSKTQVADTSREATKPHVVIILHGIRTLARWQNSISGELEKSGFIPAETNYGRFNLIQFLVPGFGFRRRIVNKVHSQISSIRDEYPDSDFSVIAHSFGTFVIAKIVEENAWKFKRIIFCGSVVKYDFPIDKMKNRFEKPILNEIGTHDIWPAVAASTTWGYGWVGSHGFRRRPFVLDRWHNGLDHSAFLNNEFFRTYWLPFLQNEELDPSDSSNPMNPSWFTSLLAAIPLKYLIVLVAGSAILYWQQPWVESFSNLFQ